MKISNRAVWFCVALLPAGVAHAGVKGFFDIGIEAGGDKVVEVPTAAGSETINGGDGVVMDAGMLIKISEESDLDLGLSVGWKFHSITASNGDISLTRFPVAATLFKNMDKHRLGVGAEYHAGLKVSGSGAGSAWADAQDDLTSQVGFLVRYDYFFSPGMAIGAKYTGIKYKSGVDDKVKDASSAGAFLTFRF